MCVGILCAGMLVSKFVDFNYSMNSPPFFECAFAIPIWNNEINEIKQIFVIKLKFYVVQNHTKSEREWNIFVFDYFSQIFWIFLRKVRSTWKLKNNSIVCDNLQEHFSTSIFNGCWCFCMIFSCSSVLSLPFVLSMNFKWKLLCIAVITNNNNNCYCIVYVTLLLILTDSAYFRGLC